MGRPIVAFGYDGDGVAITKLNLDTSQVAPDANNTDCTDFPRKGCKICGRRDRPQWDGQCNDGSCTC